MSLTDVSPAAGLDIGARRFLARIAAMIPLTVAAAAGLWGLQPLWQTVAPAVGQFNAAMPDLLPALALTGVTGATAAVLIRFAGRWRHAR